MLRIMKMETWKYVLETVLSFIGLILIIFGWVVPNWIKHKDEKKQWKKNLIDEQISKLYGPISSILNEMQIGYEIVLAQLKRSAVFDNTPLTEKEKAIWIDYLENFNLPKLNLIVDVFRTNLHLVYGACIPECYSVFIKYVIDWTRLHDLYKKNLINDYELHATDWFPTEFKFYINNTLSLLWDQQRSFIVNKKSKNGI